MFTNDLTKMSRPGPSPKKRALMSWSSGKDSAWALYEVLQGSEYEVVGLFTTMNAAHERVAMHAVRQKLVQAQAQAVGLPLWEVPLPWPCSNEEYEQIMREQLSRALQQGISHMIFGDLFLEDIRKYREERLKSVGITPVFPLWQRPSLELAHEMLRGGLVAHLTAVDPSQLDKSFAGRVFDHSLLNDLPASVDPCGENGEFHSFVSEAPVFKHSIDVSVGAVTERDNFVFCDLVPLG